jgi:hypothetical protein
MATSERLIRDAEIASGAGEVRATVRPRALKLSNTLAEFLYFGMNVHCHLFA